MSTPSSSSRQRSNLPLPQWAYVPGDGRGADADHDTLWQARRWCRRAFAITCRRGIRRCATAWRSTTAAISGKSQEVLEAVWAAAPQGGRERILLRACIQIANANLRLRMQKPHAAARLLGEALGELQDAQPRKAAGGDGFADGFPTAALAELLQGQTGATALSKADWVKFGAVGRT